MLDLSPGLFPALLLGSSEIAIYAPPPGGLTVVGEGRKVVLEGGLRVDADEGTLVDRYEAVSGVGEGIGSNSTVLVLSMAPQPNAIMPALAHV